MKGELPEGWRSLGHGALTNAAGDMAYLSSNMVRVGYESLDGYVEADAPVEVIAALLRAAGWVLTPPGGRDEG